MRNLDKSTRTKEIAKKDSLPLEVLQLDVTDDKSVADAIDMTSNRHRRIDVLVNNAGYDMHGAVEDLTNKQTIIERRKRALISNLNDGSKKAY
jgi:NADP-dependent 3-hydroxy acid dehydrogenase YdfG